MALPNPKTLKIDLRQIGYFTAIADCGSITKAAALMGVAQPSLSEAVARLERDLEVSLVVRNARGIALTEAGAALARHGHSILASVEEAVFDIRQLSQEMRGRVALGLPAIITNLLGVPLAETVANQYPDVKLRINESTSLVILDWIRNRRVDFAVSYEGYDFSGLDAQPLLEEELYLLAAPDDWPGGADENGIAHQPVRFEELAKLPLILPNRPNGLRSLLDQVARSRKVELESSIEFDSLHNLVSMVTRASYYTILSHAAVVREVAKGDIVLVPIIEPSVSHRSFTLRRAGVPVSPSSQLVERMLVSICDEMIRRYGLCAKLATPAGS